LTRTKFIHMFLNLVPKLVTNLRYEPSSVILFVVVCCGSTFIHLYGSGGIITSLFVCAFVNLIFFLWVSPSLRSSDFSNALQPKSRRASAQCRGQWNLMDAQSDFVEGAHMSTDRRSNSSIAVWYSPNSVLRTGARTFVCTWMHISSALATSRRTTASKYSAVVHKQTCSCRIIDMYQPPSMRLKLIKNSVMPCLNNFKPLRSPTSTLLFCAGELATPIMNASIRRQHCR
jgi:hypothetical protein